MQEFERQQRDRLAEAEVRAQMVELRQMRDAGLLGSPPAPRSSVPLRPVAYIAQEGEARPFPAAFKPVRATEPPVAVAVAAARAVAAAAGGADACDGPALPLLRID